MNIALIYATKTGHSRKIAQAAAAALGVKALDLRTNPKIGDVDQLFVVGGIYGGVSAPELLEYVRGLEKGQVKRAAIMTSSVSQSARQTDLRAALLAKGIDVMEEEFKCRGAFLFIGIGRPNAEDLNSAAAFAAKHAQKAGSK